MKKVICSEKAPEAIGPYSQAMEAGGGHHNPCRSQVKTSLRYLFVTTPYR